MASAVIDHPIQILVVEDCKSDVLLFKHLLGDVKAFCTITDVPRLIDAFKSLDSTVFDVIMLDLNLIDLDGVANIAALKAQCPSTPVIVYSGSSDARLKKEAMMVGASGFLVKSETNAASLQETVALALAG